MSKQDQIFDNLSRKFVKNIYGTTKGQLRHTLITEHLVAHLSHDAEPGKAIDLGAGTGIMSKELLGLGYQVTLVDGSEEILRHAEAFLADYPNKQLVHSNLQDISNIGDFDLVVCHAVLEWLVDPLASVREIIAQMRPDALLSLSFFNRDAKLFGNAVYGNFDYIARGMDNRNTVRLNPNNALVPKDVIETLNTLDVELVSIRGVRCMHDYLKDGLRSDEHYTELLDFEREYGVKEPFMWLGKYMHLIIRKRKV